VFYINNLNCGWIFDQILSPEGPFETKTNRAKQVLVGWAYACFHVADDKAQSRKAAVWWNLVYIVFCMFPADLPGVI